MDELQLVELYTKTQRLLYEVDATYCKGEHSADMHMMIYRYPGKWMREMPEFHIQCVYRPSRKGGYVEIEEWMAYGLELSDALMNLRKKLESLFPPDKYPPDKYPYVHCDD